MNLYLISQTVNKDYDTYDSAVVCAVDGQQAKKIHPGNSAIKATWCHPKDVTVKYLGKADQLLDQGIICASFNAG